MSKKIKLGIVGGGAVGLSYAYFLADVADVVVKTRRKAQAKTININGVELTAGENKLGIKKFRATDNLKELRDCSAVIVALKSYDTADIAKQLSTVLSPGATVLSLQNGLQALPDLRANIENRDPFSGGVTYIGARCQDDRKVIVGQGRRTVVDAKAEPVVGLLKQTDFEVEVSGNIKQAIWDKMILNTGQNALSAVTNMSVRMMLSSKPCLDIAGKILEEFRQVANIEGIAFKGSLIEQLKANWRFGNDFYPSMWQDLYSGKRTEIDAINGAVSQLGKKHGIATPYNNMITSLIKALESRKNH